MPLMEPDDPRLGAGESANATSWSTSREQLERLARQWQEATERFERRLRSAAERMAEVAPYERQRALAAQDARALFPNATAVELDPFSGLVEISGYPAPEDPVLRAGDIVVVSQAGLTRHYQVTSLRVICRAGVEHDDWYEVRLVPTQPPLMATPGARIVPVTVSPPYREIGRGSDVDVSTLGDVEQRLAANEQVIYDWQEYTEPIRPEPEEWGGLLGGDAQVVDGPVASLKEIMGG